MSGPQASTSATPQAQLARYAIEQRLGDDSSGVAYLAYDPRLRRKVVLRLSSDTGGSSAALAEARSLARLSHPNVARVHDVGIAPFEGRPVNYVALEYVDGQLWARWTADATAQELVRAGADLCLALAVLHDADLPHGALEASDVRVNENGRVVVHGLATGRSDRAAKGRRRQADQVASATMLSEALGTRCSRAVASVLDTGHSGGHASMREFAEALREASTSRTPWPWIWLASAAILAAGLAMFLSSRQTRVDCEAEVVARVGAVWGEKRRADLRAAVFASEVLDAQPLVEHLEPILDRYAEDWTRAAHENCEARNAAPRAADVAELEAHGLCLESARAELDAFLTLLEQDDELDRRKAVVGRALKSATRLPDIGACARGEGGGGKPRLQDAAAHAQQLAWIVALKRAGRDDAAEDAASEMLNASGIDDSVRSRLHMVRASMRLRARDFRAAEDGALAAYNLSVTANDISQQVRTASLLVSLYGQYLTDFPRAELWLGIAKKRAARPEADPLMAAVVKQHEGNYLYARGRYADALEALDRAIEIRTKLQGAEHDMVYALRNNHAATLRALGRSAEAEAEQRRMLAYLERTYGTMNAEVARGYNNVGSALNGQGRHAEAVKLLNHAVEIWKATKGPEYPDLGMAYSNLGNAYALLGDERKAEANMELAVQVWRDAFGPENRRVGIARNNLAGALVTAGRYERGLVEAEAAYRIQAEALGTDHPDLAYPVSNAVSAAMHLGRLALARKWADVGLALVVESDGKLPTEAAEIWMVASELRLREAQEPGASADLRTLAIADLTRACEIADEAPAPLFRRANAAMLLADALHEFGRPGADEAAARALALLDEGPLTDEILVAGRARLAARIKQPG